MIGRASHRPSVIRTVSWKTLVGMIREDYRIYKRYLNTRPKWESIGGPWLCPGFVAVTLYRISRFFYQRDGRFLSRLVYLLGCVLTHCELAPACEIGRGLIIENTSGVILATAKLGDDVVFKSSCGGGGGGGMGTGQVPADVGAGPGLPVVGHRVVFKHMSSVYGPVRIGDDVILEPCAFVHRDVEPGTRVYGFRPSAQKGRLNA